MNICVVGLQWGDEGKGKIVDILAEKSDVVVRYGGGSNAGHTVVIGDERFALHLLPSGSIRPKVACVIANAVVVDPEVLIREIDGLAQRGISLDGRLFISENAHVVLDYHKREDQLREESLGKQKIGTTVRGIGPCYADKVGRSYAIRMSDFRSLGQLNEKLRTILDYKNKLFCALYGAEPMSLDAIMANCKTYAQRLVPFVTDTTELLHEAIPAASSFALLVNPATSDTLARDMEAAGRALGLRLLVLRAGTEREIETAFAALVPLHAGALVIGNDAFFSTQRERLAALTVRHQVPAIFQFREFAAAGGLMSYGSSDTEVFRLVGGYTGRILKGEKPADLPVQQATKFELFVNLKTAKALGLTVPQSILLRADEVIE